MCSLSLVNSYLPRILENIDLHFFNTKMWQYWLWTQAKGLRMLNTLFNCNFENPASFNYLYVNKSNDN